MESRFAKKSPQSRELGSNGSTIFQRHLRFLAALGASDEAGLVLADFCVCEKLVSFELRDRFVYQNSLTLLQRLVPQAFGLLLLSLRCLSPLKERQGNLECGCPRAMALRAGYVQR